MTTPYQRDPARSPNADVYESLQFDAPASQIRLLYLHSGAEDDVVRCQLTVHDVKEAPAYRAISYTWGDSNESRAIVINDKSVSIGRNCQYALWQARLHFPSSYVWIDAICINQSDLEEKSFQVARMYNVYLVAESTLACVGEDDGSSEILQNTKELWSHVDCTGDFEYSEAMAPAMQELFLGWAIDAFQTGVTSSSSPLGTSWLDIFVQRPYFQRLWIIQELHAACRLGKDRILLLCGMEHISWDLLSRMDRLHSYSTSSDPQISSHFRDLDEIVSSKKLQFDDLLRRLSKYLCADPRDRIYGCSRLININMPASNIQPDYTKTQVEIAMQLIDILNAPSTNLWMRGDDARAIVSLLEIDFRHRSMRKELQCVRDRMQDVERRWKLDTLVHIGRVRTGSNGYLMLSSTLRDVSTGNYKALRGRLDRSGRSARCSPVPILDAKGNHAGLACSGIQPGDLIIFTNSGGSEVCFVLRRNKDDTFEILGQYLSCQENYHDWPRFTKGPIGHESKWLELEATWSALLTIFANQRMIDEGFTLKVLHSMGLDLNVPARAILRNPSLGHDGLPALAEFIDSCVDESIPHDFVGGGEASSDT